MSPIPCSAREVKVETTAYGAPGIHWCEVIEVVAGDAATYPVRVRLPQGGIGQFSHAEVRDWRE